MSMGSRDRPTPPINRSGLSQLAYRIGDYTSFRQRLLDALPEALQGLGQQAKRPLAELSTRDDDDPAIALLDAWAVVADVLTFYQERIANEGFIQTAIERRSVLELARAIGYELNPGVAASSYLSFKLENTPGSPQEVDIPPRAQVMSVPLKDELPQLFETLELFTARLEWNGFHPRSHRPQNIGVHTQQIYLQGTNLSLNVGDLVLLVNDELNRQEFLLLLDAVTLDPDGEYTLIRWRESWPEIQSSLHHPKLFKFQLQARLFGYNAPAWEMMPAELKLTAITQNKGAIQGGVFSSTDHGADWTSTSQGLPNSDILCLATQDDLLLAGTPDRGIFRSTDRGDSWTVANEGLTSMNVLTLHITAKNTSFNGAIFAGTANGGVFRSKDQGKNWVAINLGTVSVEKRTSEQKASEQEQWKSINTSLPNTIVRALTTYEFESQAASDSNDKAASDPNDKAASDPQDKPVNYILVGTDDGIFYSTDFGKNWTLIKSTEKYAIYAVELVGESSIVAGTDAGILLFEENNSHESNALSESFKSNKVSKNIEESVLCLAHFKKDKDEKNVVQEAIDEREDKKCNEELDNALIILAGSEFGVYRSKDQGKNWFNISSSENGNLRGVVRSLVAYQHDEILYALAATDHGVFVSNNLYAEASSVEWKPASQDFMPKQTLALAQDRAAQTISAGMKFAGFLNPKLDTNTDTNKIDTYTTNTSIQEWPGFHLVDAGKIDLETLYPKILQDTWFALFDKRYPQSSEQPATPHYAIRKIKEVVTLDRSDFGLNGKINRLIPDIPLQSSDNGPPDYGLRSTIVLAQSSELALAPEPLTIRDRQSKIFQDPINRDIVFLENLVQNLQPGQTLMVSGKHMRMQLNDVGGIFHRIDDDTSTKWSCCNTGIVNSQILSLSSSSDGNSILAGTTAGLYLSDNRGLTWSPFDLGLQQSDGPEKLTVNVILMHSLAPSIDVWFIGTPEGVFTCLKGSISRSVSEPNRWHPLGHKSLVHRDVRAMAIQQENGQPHYLLIGTIAGGLLKLDLKQLQLDIETVPTQESRWREILEKSQWQPTGLDNTDVQAILIQDTQQNQQRGEGTRDEVRQKQEIYAGTIRDGLFRSLDRGITWEKIINTRLGLGYLTSEATQVTCSSHPSGQKLRVGDVINAAGQSRTIVNLGEGDVLIINTPFRPDLLVDTPFTINTGLSNREITALEIDQQWLYAGTAGGGVFRSKIDGDEVGGDRWEQKNINLEDLRIRCIAKNREGHLWVGTATQGIFRSENHAGFWSADSTNLSHTDIQTIITVQKDKIIAGGIGVLISEDGLTTTPLQRYDIVHIVHPPQLLQSSTGRLTQWLLRNKDQFVGSFQTTAKQPFLLLPAGEKDALVSEIATVQQPPTSQQKPVLILQDPLTYSYDPATLEIAANLVEATHGETVTEILGSGDGKTPNQQFALKKLPLTYIPTANATGSASTLEVRVDGVLWEEVDSLYSLEPQDQAYMIRIEDDGTTTITFGDGVRGARIPSGQENVSVQYRSGIGTDANLAAKQLTILKSRYQGLSEVTNALTATGAANRERLFDAQMNAPLTTRNLGRIVSLQDFQDFAHGFRGIGKAQAIALWDGNAKVVHLTIAGIKGVDIPESSKLYQTLEAAIEQARDPMQQVYVGPYQLLRFNLEARILKDPRYEEDSIRAQLTTQLMATFAFEQRRFGQSVTAAEIIAALQQVAGVIAVDIDALYRVDRSRTLNSTLTVLEARYNPQAQTLEAAQLLLINLAGVQLMFVSTL